MKDFNYFKKKVLEHLEKLEKQEAKDKKQLKKSLLNAESMAKGGKGLPVGTVQTWHGKNGDTYKVRKIAPGEWKRVYDSNTRGAKMAIAALRRKAEKITDSNELMQLILKNRDRFSDSNGRPLPFVKELSDFVSKRNDDIEKENTKAAKAKAKEKKLADDKKQKESLKKLIATHGGKEEQEYRLRLLARQGGTRGKLAREILKEDFDNEPKENVNKMYFIKDNFDLLNNIFKTGETAFVNNAEIGKIAIELGETGKGGYGLKHIIEQRYTKDKLNVDEISALCALIVQTAKDGKITREAKDRLELQTDNGIVTIVKKEGDKGYKWVLTGFDNWDKKQEATDAIKTVNAQDSYAQERSDFRENVGAVIASLNENIPQTDKKSSDISTIREHYESTKSVTGNKKTVTLPNGEKMKCHYKLVEADAPTASHDETTYAPTKGFPQNENGKNINDRDYEHDKDAQESVRKIASNFNSLALESPPIVTKDGIVISGNNRTMSSKLAAKNGTDKAYLADLKEMIDEYGLEESDLDGFKNPRLVLEVDEEHKGDYTTEEFAQFNKDNKKTMSNVEKAVKLTKTLNTEKIQSIAESLTDYDTMGELYADTKGCQMFVNRLIQAGIIGDNEKAQYLTSDGMLNDTGKDFAETVLVGSVLNENNIRKLDTAGGKRIRQKLVRAILPLIENKGTGKEYSFNNELNAAVDIAVNVAKNHETFPDVKTYLDQQDMFESGVDKTTGRLAEIIHDEGEKKFAQRMKDLGAGLRSSASGEQDIFLGGVESKESLMERFLEVKKALNDFMQNRITKTVREIMESL